MLVLSIRVRVRVSVETRVTVSVRVGVSVRVNVSGVDQVETEGGGRSQGRHVPL